MATKDRWYFFGELRLWREGVRHVPHGKRGHLSEFQGVDRQDTYHYAGSANYSHSLDVHTLFSPTPGLTWPNQRSFRSHYDAMRLALEDRSTLRRPVLYIDDGSSKRTVTNVAGLVLTI